MLLRLINGTSQSVEKLEYVNCTIYIVLASSKLVLQKTMLSKMVRES